MRTACWIVGACLGLAAGGCRHLPAAPASPQHVSPSEAYYRAPGGPDSATLEALETRTMTWVRERLTLPARVPAPLRGVPHALDPIRVVHYRPVVAAGVRRPAVLMSPILANSRLLVDQFAERLAGIGIHVLLVERKELAFDPHASFQEAEVESRLVVMRSRQVVDWLETRADVDPGRLGTFGISAGAIVSSMLGGADRRLGVHVWMLGGGPLADVMAETTEGRFETYRRETTRATGLTEDAVRARLRASLRTDPIRLAPYVRRDRLLLVLADRDRSVPTRWGYRLWEALGRPELRTTPLGHYTTFALLPWLLNVTTAHFEAHFRIGRQHEQPGN